MEHNQEDLNRYQIIRKDGRNCFVETKSDCFGIGKVHLEFATYNASKPKGQRQTNHVHIYIDISEFLSLAYEALTSALHMRGSQQKAANDTTPLFKHLGGTSAQKLSEYGRSRPDGMSLSRTLNLVLGQKTDYAFYASSGKGETNATGLIVPRFGSSPENHISMGLSWRDLNELLLMTKTHYEAWLAAQYVKNPDPRLSNGYIS